MTLEAILENEDTGALALVEPGDRRADMPCYVWTPETNYPAMRLENIQALQKWGEWTAIEPKLYEVPM